MRISKYYKRIDAMILQSTQEGIKLNLGCGTDYRKGWVNCDIHRDSKYDMYVDLTEKLPFKTNYANKILLNVVLEHLPNHLELLNEMKRVLKPGGKLIMIIPHFTCCYYHADQTHQRAYSYMAIKNFCSTKFVNGLDFKENKIRLMFSKNMLWWDYIIEPIANYFPNLYEYTPLRMFQCWEIYAELEKK